MRHMHDQQSGLTPGTPEHKKLDRKLDQLQSLAGRSEGSGIGSEEHGYPDLKGPTKRGGRGSKGKPKTIAQNISLDRPIERRNQDQISKNKAIARNARKITQNESQDLYDVVLDHLLSEGYADDARSAAVIMTHMSDEWLSNILGESKSDDQCDQELKDMGVPESWRNGVKRTSRRARNHQPKPTERQQKLQDKLSKYKG
jgi:hypothetical protein